MADVGNNTYTLAQQRIKLNLAKTQATEVLASTGIFAKKSRFDNLKEIIDTATANVGASIFVLDSNNRITHATNKFYLTSVSMARKERVQLLEAFNSANLMFFGESVRVYNFSCATVDYAEDSDTPGNSFAQSSIIQLYDDVLRGSKLAEQKSIGVLQFVNHTIYGYPLNLDIVMDSAVDKVTQFSFSMVVSSHELDLPGVVSKDILRNMVNPESTLVNADVYKLWNALFELIFLKDNTLENPITKINDIDLYVTLHDLYDSGIQGQLSEDFQTSFIKKYNGVITQLKDTFQNLDQNLLKQFKDGGIDFSEITKIPDLKEKDVDVLIDVYNSLIHIINKSIQGK